MVKIFDNAENAVDALIQKVGKKLVIVMPVALGKPNHYINTIFDRAEKDSSLDVTFISALVPEKPKWGSDLERRMLEPMHERLWSKWPVVKYFEAIRQKNLPPNVHVFDMYTKAGAIINEPYLQQNYMNFSYTMIARNLIEFGANVCASLFAKRVNEKGEIEISGASNTDLFFNMARMARDVEKTEGRKVAVIGQISDKTPFLHGNDVSPAEFFDFLLDGPDYNYPLFAVPKPSVATVDHMIGLWVSSLIKDSGTIQIGIGALADAIVNAILMRHEANADYQEILKDFQIQEKYGDSVQKWGNLTPFQEGLHVNSEMMVEPFIELMKRGIVKRKVYDHIGLQQLINDKKITENKIPANILELLLEIKGIQKVLTEEDFKTLQYYGVFKPDLTYTEMFIINKAGKQFSTDLRDKANVTALQKECIGKSLINGYCIGASFFLGSQGFYDTLLTMDEETRNLIRMNNVLVINQLYGGEKLRRLQRQHARFINTGMYLTLMGGVASDMLEDGRVISGVGGQYNFVEMGLALEGGKSILVFKSTKGFGKKLKSNIRFSYGHITIPKYLRDIVVTEYGIADLRVKSDADCIKAILNIADSRFQDKLLAQAKAAKKIPEDYEIPAIYRNNYPEVLEQKLAAARAKGHFKPFPFGSDYTAEEMVLGGALKMLKRTAEESKITILKAILKSPAPEKLEKAMPYLKRMQLDNPKDKHERINQKLVVLALELIKKI
jgi:hypothetical protein